MNYSTYKVLFFLFLFSSSQKDDLSVSFFFNPSHSYFKENHKILISCDKHVITDTIVKNNHVDNSLLLKCLKISKNQNHIIKIEINDKDTILIINDKLNCISIFANYDDNSRAIELYNLKSEKKLKNYTLSEDRKLSDSIKVLNESGVLNQINIDIKKDSCWCN